MWSSKVGAVAWLRNAVSPVVEVAFGLLAMGATLWTSEALACDWDYGGNPGFLLPEEGAHIPANVPAFLWTPVFPQPVGDQPQLQRLGEASVVALDIQLSQTPTHWMVGTPYDVRPLDYLEPGATYHLTTPNTRAIRFTNPPVPLEASFIAGQPAELPTALGAIAVEVTHQGMLTVAEAAGCAWEVPAQWVDLVVVLDASAEPWRDVLAFSTIVDGERWYPASFSGDMAPPGSSWIGRGRERVYAICDERAYAEHSWLEPGEHVVQIEARLPGLDAVFTTATTRLLLNCGAVRESAGGCQSTGSPGGFAPVIALVLWHHWRFRQRRH